jgi:hypothetical protein
MNRSGFVVVALVFVGLFALLAGWTARDIVKVHQADNQLVQR